MLIRNYSLNAVEIKDPVFTNAFEKEQEYLRSIEADRLLAGFRETAGLEKKADRYPGGWENGEISGHTLGHYMVALSQLYAATGEEDIKERLDYILRELALCQNENGYLFTSGEAIFDRLEKGGLAWTPWYTLHKVLSGLLTVYQLVKMPQALDMAVKLGLWVYHRVSGWTDKVQKNVLSIEYGGMNDCLYELFKETGRTEFAEAAEKFDEVELFEQIAEGKDVLGNKHANATIPKFLGALNRYLVMPEKEEIYLKAAKKFFSIVQNGHTYVTGGNSEWEHFRIAGELGANRTQCNCETCNSYNMLKLAERLFIVTGAKKYMDFYERTFFNAILGSQNPETGMTTYYQPMATGFFKVFSKPFSKFWCCTGTGMESFTKLNRAIYHKTDERIYVNLYLSSVLKDKKRGVVLTQTVDINRFDSAEFELQTDGPKQFALCVRVPEWTKETIAVTINGEALECPQERGYLIIDRTWCFGDKAVVSFAPSLMLHPLPDAKNSAAVTYGPLVLAAGLGQDEMLIEKTGINVTVATRTVPVRKHITVLEGTVQEWFDNFETNFVKQDDMSFTLKGTDAEELLFTPYYKHYNGRYGIYFDYYTSEELPSELREEWDEKQRQEEERRRQEEEERLRREEEARIVAEKAAEEERLRKEEEERLAAEAAAEEERRRLEEEARLAAAAAEAELARLAAEAAEEEAARLATIAAEEEDRLRKEEEERRRQEEEERRQREEEERLRREEEDRLRKQEEERLAAIAAAEAAATAAIEEERRRQEEEERLRREEEERLAAEAAAEEERLRREEEERIRKEEEERLAEEERLRREEEERLAEEERLRREEEERIRKEEEERLRKEEEERLRKEEEERLAEEARLAAIRAEEEAIAEMERRRREEEEMAAKIKEEAEKIAAQSVADAAHAAEVAEAKQREEEAALQATKFALERAQAEAELKKIQAEAEEADLAIETAKAAKAEQIAKQDKAKEASAKSVKKSFMKRNKFYKRRGIMKVLGTILAVLVVIVLLYVFAKPVTKGVFMAKDTVDTFLVKNFPKVAKTLKIKGDGAAIPVFQDDTKTVYCVEDAERFIATSVWPVGYQASVHKMDGKEYICVEGNGLKIYYLNELEENDVKHIYMEKGDYKAISFREYSFDNPDLLCPVAGVYNKDGADQYVFWDDEQKSSLTILDGETLENCRIAPIEPALEEMVDINAFTELEKTVLIDMEVQGVPYVFSVPKAAGAFNTADYAVNCTEGLVYTLQEDGLRFDAYVVSSGAYLGKVVGKMPCENQGYALKQLDFYAYAEESFGDQLQDPVIEATTLENAEKERVALVGDRGERLLIPVRSDAKRNEYDKDFFVKAQNGELSYNLYGQPASVKGIDVSKYQDKIDWTKVAASGAEYAMIRLGFRGMGPDGTCELDPFFKQNVQGATKAGMEVGVYFFSQATNEEEAKEEAQFVIKNLKNYKITWPVVFDTEEISTYDARANSITREMRTNCAKVFMDEIKAAGYTPMLYANTRWSILKLDMSKLQDYDFWYAYYGDPDSVYYPYHFTMWQYSNSGTVDGIKGNVDLNISFVDYGAKN